MSHALNVALSSPLTIVNQHVRFPPVSLVDPSPSVFIHLAAEVDRRPAFLPSSRRKRRVIRQCKALCRTLRATSLVTDATVFNALLVPPGRGEFLHRRPVEVHVARFDLAILIECKDRAAADTVMSGAVFSELLRAFTEHATFSHIIMATNARRIGPVDHGRPGVFLFNYFFADRTDQNLAVWSYTAGWFQAETGLDNSTVLLPIAPDESQYSVINHCRWDSLRQVLPSLVFKKSFHSYVLDNFAANNVAAMPVLYRLA